MRAPAVLIFGADELSAGAELRAAREAARKIRIFAVGERGQDIAAPHLIAEEMRRGRHDYGVGRLSRHPVGAGKMKAADAARLMTAGAGHIVQPPLEAGSRADIERREAARGELLPRPHDILVAEDGVLRAVFAGDETEGWLQVGGRKSDRGRRDRALHKEALRNHD